MKYDDQIAANMTIKRISTTELINLITTQPNSQVKFPDEDSTILIENYVIEDEYIFFDESIIVQHRLTFKDCFFICENSLFIDGIVCKEYVTFENCCFSKGIFLKGGNFKKDLSFKQVFLEHFRLSGGTYDNISLSGNNMNEIRISGGKFKNFRIGEYISDDNIGKLIVFSKHNEIGNITVSCKNFDEIYLSGTNKDRIFEFEKINCNTLSIINFVNEGSLNFYGIKPKDIMNENRYIQINNSNLGNAQFYRAFFSLYKEFIVIDSFIAECLFLGCHWQNNIRAIRGPGYSDFKESLKNGRMITKDENFAIKEAYRQLKISMSKHSDKIQESKFYGAEMNYHNLTLTWSWPWNNQFWDKLILYWSRIFSNYGQSFIRPLFFLFLGHLFLFLIALLLKGYYPLHISFSNPTSLGFEEAFEKYFIFINPLRRLETSLSGYLIFIDLLMRIWSSYMLYNLIRASRRFII